MQQADQPGRWDEVLQPLIGSGSDGPVVTLNRRRLALCAVAAAAALAVGIGGAKLYAPGSHRAQTTATAPSGSGTSAKQPAAPVSPTPVAPAGPPAAPSATTTPLRPTALPTVFFADRRTGFQVSYPRTWSRLASHTAAVPLLASSRDGVSFQVQALELRHPIDARRLAIERDLTGAVIRARPGAQIVAGPRLLAVANLPGFLYIYSFYDPLSHRRVGHSQIVLFAGRRMFTLVFQTARAADLPVFAMLFDKITASFRVT